MRLRVITFFLVVIAVTVLLYEFGGPKASPTHREQPSLTGSSFASFTPISTSFPTAAQGWVLGTVHCSSRPDCVQLRSTRDGGVTWKLDQLPGALLKIVDQKYHHSIAALNSSGLNVRFANAFDGWMYGTLQSFDYFGGITTSRWLVVLWSTHNGGVTWTKQNPPGLGLEGTTFDLEATSHEVYLLGLGSTARAVVVESPVQRDDWTVATIPTLGYPAGGSETTGNIVVSGGEAWLIEGNDRGITGSLRLIQNGQWSQWSAPCASVGDSYVVPVASDARNLGVVCELGGVFSQPTPNAPPGAKPGSWWLYVSNNRGSSFHPMRELHGAGGYFAALASPTPHVFFFQYGSGSGDNLEVSRNDGRNVRTVFRGLVTYLHFVNTTTGIGIAESRSNTSEMIVTRNGGKSWHVQDFPTKSQ